MSPKLDLFPFLLMNEYLPFKSPFVRPFNTKNSYDSIIWTKSWPLVLWIVWREFHFGDKNSESRMSQTSSSIWFKSPTTKNLWSLNESNTWESKSSSILIQITLLSEGFKYKQIKIYFQYWVFNSKTIHKNMLP